MNVLYDTLRKDLKTKTPYDFFVTHIARSNCWYFSNYLKVSEAEMLKSIDDLREIISKTLKISFNSIQLVGSAKIGVSLKPQKDICLQPFKEDGEHISDIDVALISNELFSYWKHLIKIKRKYISTTENTHFNNIFWSTNNGYINVHDIVSISIIKNEWLNLQNEIKRRISDNLNIRHELTYRIYKDWDFLEKYQLKSIKDSKEIILEEGE
jgi:hypothetical protein